MTRSIWKGPFVHPSLLKKIDKIKGATNKKPIKTIITDDIADKTCALSNAGEIVSIEKKFPNWKKKSIEPIIISVLPLKFIHI